MDAMWNALSALERTLMCVAVPATLVLLVELIMLLAGLAHGASGGAGLDDADGLDMDGLDADGLDAGEAGAAGMGAPDADAPHTAQGAHGELRMFTLMGVASFFAVSGWAGLALMDASLPGALAAALAAGLGALAMYGCALALRWFAQLGEAGNVALRGAVGRFAEAYLPIAPGRAEGGKVALTLQGRFMVLDAVTDAAEAIPTGARVVVTGLADSSTLLVRPARDGK